MLTFYVAKFTCDLELPANLLASCSSHVTTFYNEFYSETVFHFGFEKLPWVQIKKKPGLKNASKVKV